MATAVLVGLSELGQIHGCATGMDFLPDIILLNIFDFWRIIEYPVRLWKSTWKWDRLVHVCQRWRQIVFASPNRLQIQLLCASGTPIKTHLSCWPAFPIILSYSVGEGLSISDEYNVLSALEHSNRIGTLDLTVTTTQSKQAGKDHADVIVSSSGVSGACDG